MKRSGYQVTVVGASSLLGKELLALLEERSFPIASLKTVSGSYGEADLPIVDLTRRRRASVDFHEAIPVDFDFAFVAGPHELLGAWLEQTLRQRDGSQSLRAIIDLTSDTAPGPNPTVRVPMLERTTPAAQAADRIKGLRMITAPHAATIMISALLSRLAARFPVRNTVAQIFSPASEMGSRAIDELQKQTVNLLSFQKVPRDAFGAQIAFNLLPRLGAGYEKVDALESRIREQLQAYFGDRLPVPALRLFQVPVFYSTALSLYVETEERVPPSDLVVALDGAPLSIHRASEKPPSQADAAGSDEILVDAIQTDAAHPSGIWFWAVADNLRLAALNAVQIAEGLHHQRQPLHLIQ